MNAERWDRIKSLLPKLEALPEGMREAAIDAWSRGDEALRDDLLRIVRKRPRSDFLMPPSLPPDGAQDVRAPDLEAGTKVAEFRILDKLGEGAMGAVYRAFDELLGREVALKLLPAPAAQSSARLSRFQIEAKAAARLSHENIVRVYSTGVADCRPYIAMQLVAGHTLDEELANLLADFGVESDGPERARAFALPRFEDPMYPRRVAEIFRDLARALQHAHGAGVLHRDIKPSNVMIERGGKPYLVDFGLAKDATADTITLAGAFVGTMCYASPERLATNREADARSDVFSLGAVLYEALSTRRAFDADSREQLIATIVSRHPTPLRRLNPAVPKDLAAICERALEKHLADRFQSAAEMAHQLDRFLAHQPLTLESKLRPRRVARAVLRSRRGFLISALAMAGASTAMSFHLWRRHLGPTLSLAGGEAFDGARLLAFDFATLRFEPLLDLDPADDDPIPLEMGMYRVVVRRPDGAFFERTIDVPATAGAIALDFSHYATLAVDHAGMLQVPGGTLPPDPVNDARPQAVVIDPFWIDETEVTIGAYREYLAASGKSAPALWRKVDAARKLLESPPTDPQIETLPMGGVTLEEARAFAEFRGKRLLIAAEWEWAARGPELRRYPWTSATEVSLEEHAARCVFSDRIAARGGSAARTTLARKFEEYLQECRTTRDRLDGRTWCGARDLLGNVKEWVDAHPTVDSSERSARGARASLDLLNAFELGGGFDLDRSFGGALLALPLRGRSPVDQAIFSRGIRCARTGVWR
jgi:serine/threonine protein kinase